jgi:hypothetical protein
MWTGGCACGQVRYEAGTAPTEAGYCHCRICQRSTGAPLVAFADVPLAEWRYTTASPKVWRSSPHGERRFCPACGTQIEYRDAYDAATLSVNLATLDDPGCVTPGFHIWTQSAVPWIRLDDGLPCFPKGRAGS